MLLEKPAFWRVFFCARLGSAVRTELVRFSVQEQAVSAKDAVKFLLYPDRTPLQGANNRLKPKCLGSGTARALSNVHLFKI